MFNQKNISLDDDKIDIISYETPLLRQKKGRGSNKFKLDLLGFSQKTSTAIAIECKFEKQNDTNPQYGLIESFFYALAIRYSLENKLDKVEKLIQDYIKRSKLKMKFEKIYVIDGIPAEEYYRQNADPITLLQNGDFEMLHEQGY